MRNSSVQSLTHTHTLDKNGSLYDPSGTESCDMHIRLVTKIRMSIYIYIYIWDYGDHQLRLTIAPRCVTTVPRVRLHGSPGGVFVGHRPPRDPGDPPLIDIDIYIYISIEVLHLYRCVTHTPCLRQGGAVENEVKMRMKGE